MWIHFLATLCLICYCNCFLVKTWGTDLKISWLHWSTIDIFSEALKVMTMGQKGAYPVAGFEKNLTRRDGTLVRFETYNGWLENLRVHKLNSPDSDLRRVVMTRAERYLHEKAAGVNNTAKNNGSKKGHQHEMIICIKCMALSSKSLHYAYQAKMNTTEETSTDDPLLLWTAGTMQTQEMIFPISFQMSIMVSPVIYKEDRNEENKGQPNKKECIILLEPLQLTSNGIFYVEATRTGRFSFLADHVDRWIENNLLNSTLKDLSAELDTSVRMILHTRNICLEILLKENEFDNDDLNPKN